MSEVIPILLEQLDEDLQIYAKEYPKITVPDAIAIQTLRELREINRWLRDISERLP